MNNNYEPIPIRPLTLRGVFGITWAVIKRNFLSAVMYTVIWTLIMLLSFGICALPAIIGIASLNRAGVAALAALSVVLVFLWAFAIWLVVNPILYGSLYTEMSMRVYGQSSSLSMLFRRTGFTLKRFFTLNLCQSLGSAVASIAASTVSSLLTSLITAGGMMGLMMGAVRSSLLSGGTIHTIEDLTALGAGFFITMLLIGLVNMLIGICASVPLVFTYPVAVNEKKKNFDALGRALNIGFKRYGRALGTTLIATAAFTLIEIIVSFALGLAIGFSAAAGNIALTIVFAVLLLLAVMFIGAIATVYTTALNTVLYQDAHTRELGSGINEPAPAAPQTPQNDAPAGQGAYGPAAYEPPAEEPEFIEKNGGTQE